MLMVSLEDGFSQVTYMQWNTPTIEYLLECCSCTCCVVKSKLLTKKPTKQAGRRHRGGGGAGAEGDDPL